MKASIHISTDMVKVLAYTKAGSRINVANYLTYPLPEESVLNGVILDGAPILDGLKSLKNAKPELFNDVSLVIDGSFVYAKKLTVPGKLSKVMYDEVIRDEFAEISTDSENLICDYFLLSTNEDGSKEILACAVEHAHAQAYLTLFAAADIKLSSVHLGILTVLQFIESRQDLSNIPFVLNVVDNLVQLSMIFQNGVNVFQSRTRLYGEERATLVRSTLDGLSGIIQFNKSQNFTDLTNCFYLGLSPTDMDLVALDTSYPDIRFSVLPIYNDANGAEQLPPNAHFAFLNTLVPDAKSDMLANMKMLEKAKMKRKPKNKWLPVLAGTLLFLIAAVTVLWLMVGSVERESNRIKKHLEDVSAEKAQIEALKNDTTRINSLYEAVAAQKEETAQLPQVSRSLLDTIIRIGGSSVTVNGMNFASDNRTLSVSCSSITELASAHFVEALKRESMIDTVYYTGFSSGSEGEFLFTIDVIADGWREEVSS